MGTGDIAHRPPRLQFEPWKHQLKRVERIHGKQKFAFALAFDFGSTPARQIVAAERTGAGGPVPLPTKTKI